MFKRVPVAPAIVLLLVLISGCGEKTDVTPQPQTTFTIDVRPQGAASQDDYFELGAQALFSTAGNRLRAPNAVSLVNQTGAEIDVSKVAVTSPAFSFSGVSQAGFSIAPNTSHSIQISLKPKSVGVSSGELILSTTTGRTIDVALRGLNAKGIESSNEPNLQQIFDAFGYKVNAGVPATPPKDTGAYKNDIGNSISTSKQPVGDEVLAPVFQRADTSRPVALVPLANYISRSKSNLGWFGINQSGNAVNTQVTLAFPGGTDQFGGQNQQLLPGIGRGDYSGLVAGSSITFVPKFPTFGIWDAQHKVSSEDSVNFNEAHQMRIYPAVDSSGLRIANTYLVAEDAINPNHYRNYDFQDFVFLLKNVEPATASALSELLPNS